MAKKRVRKRIDDLIVERSKQSDVYALAKHFQENPLLYTAGLAFVAVCLLAALMYNQSQKASAVENLTRYSKALSLEDPQQRVTEMEALAGAKGALSAEFVYMYGEAAYAAGDYEKAKAAFERVRAEFPESEFVPAALEGLGYIAENEGDIEKALGYYQQIEANPSWALSFTGKRQPINIARSFETLGKLSEAVQAYQRQAETFPGSSVALEAQAELERLREAHPDLPEFQTLAAAEEPAAADTGVAAETGESPSAGGQAQTGEESAEAPAQDDTAPEPGDAAPPAAELQTAPNETEPAPQ